MRYSIIVGSQKMDSNEGCFVQIWSSINMSTIMVRDNEKLSQTFILGRGIRLGLNLLYYCGQINY